MSAPGLEPRVRETLAPAKLNLTLGVLGRRADGFHELRSVFFTLALGDHLSAEPLPAAAGSHVARDRLVITGSEQVPVQDNLVLRAAGALRAELARPLPALSFRLHKAIPVAAGLGGGSSDAAAALRLAAAAWDVYLPVDRWRDLAAELGSDVPYFAPPGPPPWALVSGRGEVVAPLPALTGSLGIVLVTPAERLSTRAVFEAHDGLARRGGGGDRGSAGAALTAELAGLASRDAMSASRLLSFLPALRDANDLWPAALTLAPRLARVRDAMEAVVGTPAILSGSGPTLFALLATDEDAQRAAGDLAAAAGIPRDATIAATGPLEAGSAWRMRWPPDPS